MDSQMSLAGRPINGLAITSSLRSRRYSAVLAIQPINRECAALCFGVDERSRVQCRGSQEAQYQSCHSCQ